MVRFRLYQDDAGYCLDDKCSIQKPLRISFEDVSFLRRLSAAGRKSELVARAVKAGRDVRVLDCTGGFGRDAMILASLGCHVTIVERSFVICFLLQQALKRALSHELLSDAASRISLQHGDAKDRLSESELEFDVIYLDPMFPPRRGSAAVGGDMQQLHRFLSAGPDELIADEAVELLDLGLRSNVRRVILKRPARGTVLSQTATHCFSNRNARYEVFVR